MTPSHRPWVVLGLLVALAAPAAADEAAPPADVSEDADTNAPKEPQAGDFDAGGRVRLPSGPDEAGVYETFNWVAVDLRGTYYITRTITVAGDVPVALIKPDTVMGGIEPSYVGGMRLTFDARLPKMRDLPMMPKQEVEASLLLTGAYMREGAMLLSEKDYPLFAGDFQPGLSTGLYARAKVSSLLDFALTPVFVYQGGTEESLMAVQVPMSLIVKLGELLKVSADVGVFTGDDFSFGGADCGRIAAGGAVDVELGPIAVHAGAGVASLLTGGLYPTIRDSVYVDLNVKYVK